MKQFDLKAALAGEPVVTRDGREVKDLAHLPSNLDPECRVIGVVEGRLRSYYDTGKYVFSESGLDLFMATKKRTVWVNFYEDGNAVWHKSKHDADTAGSTLRTGGRAWPVEIEE